MLEYTGIGSLPFKSFEESMEIIELFFMDGGIPFWPQLPKRSSMENMYAQFWEGFPGGFVKNGDVYIEREIFHRELEDFYSAVLEGDPKRFLISRERAEGLYAIREFMAKEGLKPKVFKIQVTGPISFGLVAKDAESKRQAIFIEEYFEALKLFIKAKIRWQMVFFREILENSKFLVFLDEPYMMSWGSAFFSYPEEDILKAFREVLDGLEADIGVHCCGNTDWGLILKCGFKVVNFDAFDYMDHFLLYKEQARRFIEDGGVLAWGVVPTGEGIKRVELKDLMELFERGLNTLGITGKRTIITPSCGTGSMEEKDAKKVFRLLRRIFEEKKHL